MTLMTPAQTMMQGPEITQEPARELTPYPGHRQVTDREPDDRPAIKVLRALVERAEDLDMSAPEALPASESP